MKKLIYGGVLLATFISLTLSANAADSFSTYMHFGSRGVEVTRLQQFLIDNGYLKIAAPTGNYLTLTKAAVQKFQSAKGVSATGYFGPITLAAANAHLAQSNQPKATVTTLSVTPASSNAASIFFANNRTIHWNTSDYLAAAGVNINLLRKTSSSPNTYQLVRQIAVNAPNTGTATWNRTLSETGSDLYIEVTCSTSTQFNGGCAVNGKPVKAS